MPTITSRTLKSELSNYLHRAESGERFVVLEEGKPIAALVALADVTAPENNDRVAGLEARGLVIPARKPAGQRFRFQIPSRGKPASEMVIEDRR